VRDGDCTYPCIRRRTVYSGTERLWSFVMMHIEALQRCYVSYTPGEAIFICYISELSRMMMPLPMRQR
jgi:hypothetical protein